MNNDPRNVDIANLHAALQQATDRHSSQASRDGSTADAVCEQWAHIVKQYRDAVKAYSEATADLSDVPGLTFNLAWGRAENLRRASISFREALFEHEQRHGCSVVRLHYIPTRQT